MKTLTFLILGILTSLLFPPYFFVPLGFIIFPYICLFIEKNSDKLKAIKFLKYSFSFGFGFFISFLFWLKNPFFIFSETKNLFFLSLIVIIILSLIFSLIFTIIIKYNKLLSPIFIVPLVFLSTEILIAIFVYGFPWFNFSLIISNNDWILISLKHFGTLITSYLIIQIFCLPYLFLTKKIFKQDIIYFFLFITLPLVITIFINLNFAKNYVSEKKPINIDIFQLNHKTLIIEDNLQIRFKNIIKHISNSSADLIIFAENNYPFLIEKLNLQLIQDTLRSDQTVIIGATRKEKDKYFNSFLNITPLDIKYFDKKILVPFGEFLPFRKFLTFIELISGSNDYSKGEKNRYIRLNNNYSYIPVICYEIIFYWKLINNLNHKSNIIINITNDIWFGDLLGPYQHFYIAKLRAAEFNKPLVRVSNNGISGFIDNNGKILSVTKLNKIQELKRSINLKNNKNFYKSHNVLNKYLYFFYLIFFLINLRKYYGR